jgi:hypothetical protein
MKAIHNNPRHAHLTRLKTTRRPGEHEDEGTVLSACTKSLHLKVCWNAMHAQNVAVPVNKATVAALGLRILNVKLQMQCHS